MGKKIIVSDRKYYIEIDQIRLVYEGRRRAYWLVQTLRGRRF